MADAVTYLRVELARLMYLMDAARAAGNDELANMLARVAARCSITLADSERRASR